MGGVISLAAAATIGFGACDDDLDNNAPNVGPLTLEKISHAGITINAGADATFSFDISRAGTDTITFEFDKAVFFADTSLHNASATNGCEITHITSDGPGSRTITAIVNIPDLRKEYEVNIPGAIITNGQLLGLDKDIKVNIKPGSKPAISENPVMATSAEAKQLYNFLKDNYGEKTISGMMANVNWNTDCADSVGDRYGKTPLINGFDYIHLYAEKDKWIDYKDITPVKKWADKGGIVAMTWHWMVPQSSYTDSTKTVAEIAAAYDTIPTSGKNSPFTYGNSSTFKISKAFDKSTGALIDSTWEGYVYKRGIETVIERLTLLKDAGIPVLWRPFHEAAGQWFWWGEDAATFKRLWVDMFNRFREAGLDNLIWVWTSQVSDISKWYPGDEYVDIIGVDIYGGAEGISEPSYDFAKLSQTGKILTLSECGYSTSNKSRIANISVQTAAGINWSWFMPWYDDSKSKKEEHHANDAWWKDAMDSDNTLWLGDYTK